MDATTKADRSLDEEHRISPAIIGKDLWSIFFSGRQDWTANLVRSLRDVESEYSIEELDSQFRRTKWIVTVAMISIGMLIVWGLHFALVALNRHVAQAQGEADFYFYPQAAIWWFLPGFAAIDLSWEITLQPWSLLASRERVRTFSDWSNQTTTMWGNNSRYVGMDSRKGLRWLGVLMVLPIGVLTLLALSMNSALTEDGLRECGYAFRGCQLRPYSTVQRVSTIDGFLNTKGRFVSDAKIVFDFRDGYRWSSTNTSQQKKAVDPELLRFVAVKTKLPVNSAFTVDGILNTR